MRNGIENARSGGGVSVREQEMENWRLRRELAEARSIIRELEDELEKLNALVGERRSAASAVVPGMTRTQAVVLAILADGGVHRFWTIGETLEILVGSQSQDFDGFVRTVICKLRSYFRRLGLNGVIETYHGSGYRIAPEHLPYVRSLLWPLDSHGEATPSSEPQPERTNHHVEHKQTP